MSLNECLVLGPDPVTIQSETHFHLEGGTVFVQLILLLKVRHCLKWDTAPHHPVTCAGTEPGNTRSNLSNNLKGLLDAVLKITGK